MIRRINIVIPAYYTGTVMSTTSTIAGVSAPAAGTAPTIPSNATISAMDLKQSLDMAHKNIEDLTRQIQKLTDTVVNCEKRISDLQTANGELREFSNALQESVINIDLASRKKNLVITGVQEVLNESSDILCAYLYDMFVEYVDTLEITDFDMAYRLGSAGAFRTKPRPILVKFLRESVRDSIAAIRAQLTDEDTDDRIYLNSDLPKSLSDRQTEFRMIQKLAKESKIPVKISGNKICVNNITYDHTNLDCLPKGLRLEDARIREHNGALAFYSKYAWLSNFYMCPVKIQGISFNSAEQAYQYVRARRNNAPELATIILRSATPGAAKLAGKGVELLPMWDSDKERIMKRVLESKFEHNPNLAAKLIATGNTQLVEATMDKFWGAHATINSKAIKTSAWEGLNKLGSLLMECREELARNAAWRTFSSSPDDSMYRPYEPSLGPNQTSPKFVANASMSQPYGGFDQSLDQDRAPTAPPRRGNRVTGTRGRGGGTGAIQHPASSQQQSSMYSVIAARGSRLQVTRSNRSGRASYRGANSASRSQSVKRPVTSPETSTPCSTKQRTTSQEEDIFAAPPDISGHSAQPGFQARDSSNQGNRIIDDSVVIGSQVI